MAFCLLVVFLLAWLVWWFVVFFFFQLPDSCLYPTDFPCTFSDCLKNRIKLQYYSLSWLQDPTLQTFPFSPDDFAHSTTRNPFLNWKTGVIQVFPPFFLCSWSMNKEKFQSTSRHPMNNSSAPCSLPGVETLVHISVPLSLLGGLDTTERQTSLMLNLISALRPVLAAFSGCEQTPWWIPSSPSLSLFFLSVALSETLTQNHPLLHNSYRKE